MTKYRIWFILNGNRVCVDVYGTSEQDAINRASAVKPSDEYQYEKTEELR